MSWRATAWAVKQVTGSPATKVILLALANYADPNGVCWPTQEGLALDTEQSTDTIQRRMKCLIELGLVRQEKLPKVRGQWPRYMYHLKMGTEDATKPPSVSTSQSSKDSLSIAAQAAPGTVTMPQLARSPHRIAVRHKPSSEPIIKPPATNGARASADERLQAFRGKRDGDEVVQNRIAQRLGSEGWLIFGALTDAQRAKLTSHERRGVLTDERLAAAKLDARASSLAND